MAEIGLAASVIAVVQLASSCLRLCGNRLGPSEIGSSELVAASTALYELHGALQSIQLCLAAGSEEDQGRLRSLDYLRPAVLRCEAALGIVKGFMAKTGFVEKHLGGVMFDRKLKTALVTLEGARDLFVLALNADQRCVFPLPPCLLTRYLILPNFPGLS